MKEDDYRDLRELLLMYEVDDPREELVVETKHLMARELEQLSLRPSWQTGWIIMLVGFACVMSMGIFYSFTVGTLLSFALPASMAQFMEHLMFALIAVGGALMAGLTMVFCFKQFSIPNLQVQRIV